MLIKIVNWKKFNNPRKDVMSTHWFRFQNTFFVDPDFCDLPLDQKWVFPYLLSVASSKMNDVVDVSESLACKLLNIEIAAFETAIKHLLARGIIEIPACRKRNVVRNARVTDSARNVTNVTERNGTNITKNTYVELSGSDESDFGGEPRNIVQAWNENCGPLPRVTALNKARALKIRARLKERPDIAYWVAAAQRMSASTFCREGKWATFDWLIKNENNHVKVTEGNYDDRDAAGAEREVDWSKVFAEGKP